MDNQELAHWGIKGMKWGRRRWQYKDGSLTPEGKKRYGDGDDDDRSESKPENNAPRVKSVSEMSNKELQDAIQNLQLQKQFKQLQKELAAQDAPAREQQKQGESFVKKFAKEALVPAVTKVGKEFAEKKLKEKLKLDVKEKDTLAELEKEYKSLNLQKDITTLKDFFKNYKEGKLEFTPGNDGKKDRYQYKDKKSDEPDNGDDRDEDDDIGYDFKQDKSRDPKETARENMKDGEKIAKNKPKPADYTVDNPEQYRADIVKGKAWIDKLLEEVEHSAMSEDELYHYGVKGMKWGIRRYQNKDGSLTDAGRKRYRNQNPYEVSKSEHLSEKTRRGKLTKEQTIKELNDLLTVPDHPGSIKLFNEINKFSGNWYDSKGVTSEFKKRVKEYKDERKSIDDKYEEDVRRLSDEYYKLRNEIMRSHYNLANRLSVEKTGRVVDTKNFDSAYDKAQNNPRVLDAYSALRKLSSEQSKAEGECSHRYEDDLCGIVLNDLGYKDSPEIRELIYPFVVWD